MMQFSYRDWFSQRFKEAKEKNAAYSLRAYARSLGVSAPFILDVMRGKAALSEERIVAICNRLKLPQDTSHLLIYSQQFEKTKDAQIRERLANQARLILEKSKRKQLTHEELQPIASWEAFAFLTLLFLPKSQNWTKANYIEFLNCTEEQFDRYIEVFLKKGVLKVNNDGTYTKTESHVLLESNTTHEEFRKIHLSLLDAAKKSLLEQTSKLRYSSSEFVAVDDAGFKKIRELTENYLDEVQMIARSCENPSQVYSLCFHIFNSLPKVER